MKDNINYWCNLCGKDSHVDDLMVLDCSEELACPYCGNDDMKMECIDEDKKIPYI